MISINPDTYREIGRKLREIPLELHVTSHEWEELIETLCESDDQTLKAIGMRELEAIMNNSDACTIFRP